MDDKGPIIFGKVENGTVKLGDTIKIMPSGEMSKITTIYNNKGQSVFYAKPGENIKLRLKIDLDKVNKGDVICLADQQPAGTTDFFECELETLELLKYKPLISKGYQCVLHLHTLAEEVTITDLVLSYEKDASGEVVEKHKPRFIRSFTKAVVRVQTRVPISLEKYEHMPQLGRFTLRDEGKTIAVGKVLRYKSNVKVSAEPLQASAAVAFGASSSGSKQMEEEKKDSQKEVTASNIETALQLSNV